MFASLSLNAAGPSVYSIICVLTALVFTTYPAQPVPFTIRPNYMALLTGNLGVNPSITSRYYCCSSDLRINAPKEPNALRPSGGSGSSHSPAPRKEA
jgi:hypothetical protein